MKNYDNQVDNLPIATKRKNPARKPQDAFTWEYTTEYTLKLKNRRIESIKLIKLWFWELTWWNMKLSNYSNLSN